MVTVAPIPIASEVMAVRTRTGLERASRSACRTSCNIESITSVLLRTRPSRIRTKTPGPTLAAGLAVKWCKLRARSDRFRIPPVTLSLIATATFGLESVVARELKALGYESRSLRPGWLAFEADESAIARANLWLRSSDRVLSVDGFLSRGGFRCSLRGHPQRRLGAVFSPKRADSGARPFRAFRSRERPRLSEHRQESDRRADEGSLRTSEPFRGWARISRSRSLS